MPFFDRMDNQEATKTAKKSSAKTKSKLPRGVSVKQRMDRGNQWQVMWNARPERAVVPPPTKDGQTPKRIRPRKAKLFPSREIAMAFALRLSGKIRDYGRRVLNFDPAAWEKWLAFQRELDGAELSDVLEVWRQHLIRKRKASITISDAVKEHVQALEFDNVDKGHLSHVKLQLRRFAEYFGEKTPLGDVSSSGVREWLGVLRDDGDGGGEGFGAGTLRHHLKSVRALYRRGIAEHWAEESPAAAPKVKLPKVTYGERLALSIEEARLLFQANRNHRVCGRLALEAFAGVRFSGSGRLCREDVVFEDKIILLPDVRHKSGARFVLDDIPECLWAWLKHAAEIAGFWDVTESQYHTEKGEAFLRAGVENAGGNILRRSHCSWGIALDGDAARVAARMQHASPEMLYKQYRTSKTRTGYVTKKEAPLWELIFP